jgi:RHS repeat-associated protein
MKAHIGNSEFGYSSTGVLIYANTIIKAPTGVCAVYQDSGGVKAYYYVHTDSQGSWLAISNTNGTVVNRYSYDAWGRPRNVADWTLKAINIGSELINLNAFQPRFDRGYTGHEIMAGFGLINMNGRLYDPYLQRFLSPDPYVQSPLNAQNYNRYSYCMNNPLMYTDPSGYNFIVGAFDFIGGFFRTAWNVGTLPFGIVLLPFQTGKRYDNSLFQHKLNQIGYGWDEMGWGLFGDHKHLKSPGGKASGGGYQPDYYGNSNNDGSNSNNNDKPTIPKLSLSTGAIGPPMAGLGTGGISPLDDYTIVVNRFAESQNTTLSSFTAYGPDQTSMTGYFLEPGGPSTTLSGLDKRIPAGIYTIQETYSNAFGQNMYLVTNSNVSADRGIRIHTGNFGSNTEGCLLVGSGYGFSNGDYFIKGSKAKYNELIEFLGSNKATLIINDIP